MERKRWSLIFIALCLGLIFSVTPVQAEPYLSTANGIQNPDWQNTTPQDDELDRLSREQNKYREWERQDSISQQWDQNFGDLERRAAERPGTVSLTTLAAPKEAKKAYENAAKELEKGKPNLSKVTKELEKAVNIYPEFASAWQLLGEGYFDLQDRAASRDAFEQAVAADPQFALPLLSLAFMALEDKRWEEAVEMSDQALEINPNLARAHYFKALANGDLGNLNEAEEAARWVQNSPERFQYPLTHYILGSIQSERGNFESAATEYRQFMEIQPTSPIRKALQEQIDQWKASGLIASGKTSDPEE